MNKTNSLTHLKEAITYLSGFIEKVLEETLDQSDFADLTPQQLQYLKVIVKLKNPTLTELANELDLTKPTVTVLADKLSEKGYIKRVHSDKDRRVMHLHIDKKGSKINALREIAHQKMAEKIRSGLSETETAILTELLKKIVKSS
jgi:MarR family transcriptional regulator, transcriptional regulator for hemolysin